MRIAFVTNLCAHYNVGTFELLARHHNVDFYFFSAGDEWYWPREHGFRQGNFHSEYLPGFKLGQTRIVLSLPWKLFFGGYDVYIKCINGRFALPITYLVARLRGKPFILWTGIWIQLQTRFQRLIYPMTRYIYRHSDAIVVYGKHVRDYLIGEGVLPSRIFVANHATDNDFYGRPVSASTTIALREKLGALPDQRIVLYLGRLEESKGVGYLLEAFALLKRADSVLVIAGSGHLQATLLQLSKELGITDRVRFTGYVPIEKSPEYYSLAHVFVLPSITVATGKEPWGLVVNEALNQGVPVVVTDAVGAAAGGLVQDGLNGFVVPERNASALAEALDRLHANPTLHEAMVAQARTTVAEWNYERNVQGYLQAIDYVLSEARE